ncbi:MAG: hypothetical protein KKD73_07485 [Proteobacteria bacterium]|nr:hypothetical protein [Pseudomonadota bacterium]MBU1639598.1 hypothetical protein [Pseudomonadota bacterium]
MKTKPLGIVKNIVEEAGMDISYAYEDLVFLEHNSYLLQFTDNDQEVVVHKNKEADESMVSHDIIRLQEIARSNRMRFLTGKDYVLSQDDDENIRLEFVPAT